MRQTLLVNRLWSSFYKKRMSREMNNYRHIEQSFQEIRAKTNNSDVREIVAKFMTKEQTYAQLIRAVGANEQKYDELRALNREKQKCVRELQIANENRRKIERPDKDNELATEKFEHQMKLLSGTSDETEKRESEFANLLAEEKHLTDELETLNERTKNMQLITDQVGGWLRRVGGKLQEQVQGVRIPYSEDKSIVEILREIASLAKQQVAQVKTSQHEDGDDSMHEREYTNVFQDQDYVTKNVRVWGGTSQDNQSEHTSKFYASGMGADSDMEDTKYNQDEYHEMLAKR